MKEKFELQCLGSLLKRWIGTTNDVDGKCSGLDTLNFGSCDWQAMHILAEDETYQSSAPGGAFRDAERAALPSSEASLCSILETNSSPEWLLG